MKARWQTALVIGASSGLGEALVKRLAAEGCRVAAVARRGDRLQALATGVESTGGGGRVLPFVGDVRNPETAPALFEEVVAELGGLDLVIFAAGILHPVAFEEYDTAKDLEMIETNFAGAVAWLNPAARRFARLKRGTIVGIGSVAGDRGRSGSPVYNASKAGLHTYLEALRNRIGRFGVGVVTIKPGFMDTAMTRGMSGLFWLITPDRAAEIILKKARKKAVTAYVPARWRWVMLIIRSIPSWLFRRLRV